MCKNDNFSSLKTKPYRSKRCKVLTNQYADKYKRGSLVLPLLYFCKIRQDLNPPVAARTSAARDGSTERNNYFLHSGKCKSSPDARTKNRQVSTCRFFIHCESNGISSRASVHLITEGVYHQPQAAFLFAMMIYKTSF